MTESASDVPADDHDQKLSDEELRGLGLKRTTAYVKDTTAKSKAKVGNARRQERHRQRVAEEQAARDAELAKVRADLDEALRKLSERSEQPKPEPEGQLHSEPQQAALASESARLIAIGRQVEAMTGFRRKIVSMLIKF